MKTLDLANQVDGGLEGFLAFFPLGGANFARVGSGVLGSLELAQGFGDVAGDFVGMHFHGLDRAAGVDHERAAQCQAFFRDVHAEVVGQLVRGVAHQEELGLADGVRRFVPDLVAEVRVGGDDEHFGVGFLELGVVVGRVFDLGRAVEGEGGGHEDHDGPFLAVREILLGHFFELAIVESLGFERQDLGIDEG